MKYLIQFTKQGYMRYTSHLDLIRLFRRALNRVDIPLQHSQGFNPHPKMSFAQPLSLGYTSVAEYLEFDTTGEHSVLDITEKLNSTMPEGITVTTCISLPQSKKTVASLITWADYLLSLPQPAAAGNWPAQIEAYLAQDEILIEKKKKQGHRKIMVQADIKPLIAKLSWLKAGADEGRLTLVTRIASGSSQNLNPEALLVSFAEFAGLTAAKETLRIERRELYFTDWEGQIKPVLEIYDEMKG